ncbi:hypothetical protein PPERSA_12154 [Pseudocohnilembus persalinus]|uniref:Uncharacterized protein n=1 Tax=Pseudocohnilembus persalinus TaxID=266149 RepID=A0A0V0R6Q7_PSEPJ|nr:hypothetical protein PPERSA_12154 [Pseudocohnilembus persalinus]|eukprot:KRX10196.1 hypothetical protein PPERSA_12154 [Pseudocohnilembus persalinus]
MVNSPQKNFQYFQQIDEQKLNLSKQKNGEFCLFGQNQFQNLYEELLCSQNKNAQKKNINISQDSKFFPQYEKENQISTFLQFSNNKSEKKNKSQNNQQDQFSQYLDFSQLKNFNMNLDQQQQMTQIVDYNKGQLSFLQNQQQLQQQQSQSFSDADQNRSISYSSMFSFNECNLKNINFIQFQQIQNINLQQLIFFSNLKIESEVYPPSLPLSSIDLNARSENFVNNQDMNNNNSVQNLQYKQQSFSTADSTPSCFSYQSDFTPYTQQQSERQLQQQQQYQNEMDDFNMDAFLKSLSQNQQQKQNQCQQPEQKKEQDNCSFSFLSLNHANKEQQPKNQIQQQQNSMHNVQNLQQYNQFQNQNFNQQIGETQKLQNQQQIQQQQDSQC